MTEPGVPSSPFSDPRYDPFASPIVRVGAPEGDRVDVIATLAEAQKAMQPELRTAAMQTGDHLTVEYIDGTSNEYAIDDVITGPQYFGDEDMLTPKATFRDMQTSEQSYFSGSSMLESGNMLRPGTLVAGNHVILQGETGQRISAQVTSFRLQRPNAEGALQDVRLNQSNQVEASPSYHQAFEGFKQIEAALATEGFSFDQEVESEMGPIEDQYQAVVGDKFIYASRQGVAIIPQDEVHVFNAAEGTLRSLRSIPSKGIMQMAVLHGLSKDAFAQATHAYNGDELDWKYAHIVNGNTLHRLSDNIPFVTYTWMSPAATTPTVTLTFDSGIEGGTLAASQEKPHNVGDQQVYPEYIAEITQSDSGPIITPRIDSSSHYWIDDYAALLETAQQMSRVELENGTMRVGFGEYNVDIAADPSADVDEMARSVTEILAAVPRFAGEQVVRSETNEMPPHSED